MKAMDRAIHWYVRRRRVIEHPDGGCVVWMTRNEWQVLKAERQLHKRLRRPVGPLQEPIDRN